MVTVVTEEGRNMNKKELEAYFSIYTEYWKIFRRYSTLEGTDKYWLNFMNEVNAAHEILQNIDYELSKALAIATTTAIQRKYREKIEQFEDRQMDLFDMTRVEQQANG